MQYQLTELIYKRESPGVPFEQFRGMIGAAVIEIQKQQTKINDLTEQLKKSNTTKPPPISKPGTFKE